MGLRAGPGAGDIADDGDRLLAAPPTRHVRWTLVLVCFMRVVALFWIAKGLHSWAAILGIASAPPPFEARSLGNQAAIVYFAVIDLVAAVGLWLTATWGGVLWLLAVMSHLVLAMFFPRFVANGSLLIGLFILCLVFYLIVSWLAAIDE